jgi:hypothetical protein
MSRVCTFRIEWVRLGLQPVPTIRISGFILSLPHRLPWRAEGQLCFHNTENTLQRDKPFNAFRRSSA